jgi:hypothetical protein
MKIKKLDHEAGHSPPSSAEVKNAWRYNYNTAHIFIA